MSDSVQPRAFSSKGASEAPPFDFSAYLKERKEMIEEALGHLLPGDESELPAAEGGGGAGGQVRMDAGGGVEMRFDRITFDPKILGGRAAIRGMRIPVSVIVGQLAHGATFEEVLAGYPDLEREDIQQALGYAAWLTQEQVHIG